MRRNWLLVHQKSQQIKLYYHQAYGNRLVIIGLIGLIATWGVLEYIYTLLDIIIELLPLEEIEEIPQPQTMQI